MEFAILAGVGLSYDIKKLFVKLGPSLKHLLRL